MNNGFSSIGGASLHGLVDIISDSMTSTTINTESIKLGGVDIITLINTNSTNISNITQATTGITYTDISSVDLTTINNNLTISKNVKCAYVPISSDDIVNKLYVDSALATASTYTDNSNTSSIVQINKQLNILNNSATTPTITAIKGFIPYDFKNNIMISNAHLPTLVGGFRAPIEIPLVNGAVSGDNITTPNLYISSVITYSNTTFQNIRI